MDPYITFLEDPLRTLRTIRFAARFNFRIEKSVLGALNNDEVRVN